MSTVTNEKRNWRLSGVGRQAERVDREGLALDPDGQVGAP